MKPPKKENKKHNVREPCLIEVKGVRGGGEGGGDKLMGGSEWKSGFGSGLLALQQTSGGGGGGGRGQGAVEERTRGQKQKVMMSKGGGGGGGCREGRARRKGYKAAWGEPMKSRAGASRPGHLTEAAPPPLIGCPAGPGATVHLPNKLHKANLAFLSACRMPRLSHADPCELRASLSEPVCPLSAVRA